MVWTVQQTSVSKPTPNWEGSGGSQAGSPEQDQAIVIHSSFALQASAEVVLSRRRAHRAPFECGRVLPHHASHGRNWLGRKETMSGVDASRPISTGSDEAGLTLFTSGPVWWFSSPCQAPSSRTAPPPPVQRSSGRDLASPGNATKIQHHHHHPPLVLCSDTLLRPLIRTMVVITEHGRYPSRRLQASPPRVLKTPPCLRLLSVVLILRSSPLVHTARSVATHHLSDLPEKLAGAEKCRLPCKFWMRRQLLTPGNMETKLRAPKIPPGIFIIFSFARGRAADRSSGKRGDTRPSLESRRNNHHPCSPSPPGFPGPVSSTFPRTPAPGRSSRVRRMLDDVICEMEGIRSGQAASTRHLPCTLTRRWKTSEGCQRRQTRQCSPQRDEGRSPEHGNRYHSSQPDAKSTKGQLDPHR